MPRRASELPDELRDEIRRLAAEDLDGLLHEAREQARARVRAQLVDAFVDAMTTPASRPLEPSPRPVGEPGLYVYGVVAADAPPAAMPPALDGSPTMLVPDGPVAAVAGVVDLAEFDEQALRANLGRIEWVERVARGHDRVLAEIRPQTTVVPMRMCTIYRTEEAVHDMLRRETEALCAALAELRGRAEWGVKAWAPARGRAEPGERDADPSGTAYMRRRRAQLGRRDRDAEALDGLAVAIHERLVEVADAAVLGPLADPPAGESRRMILNSSYLVADAAGDGFRGAVAGLAAGLVERGIEFDVTGPWPAYSFVPAALGATL